MKSKNRPHLITALALATSASIAFVLPTGSASAAPTTFVVDTLSDNPGDGNTLREAIDDANSNDGADTIEFAPGLTGTLKMVGGIEMPIIESVTIAGPGSQLITIDADTGSRVFNSTMAGVDFSISGLTLANGASGFPGGAINMLTGDSFTMNDVVVSDSSSLGRGGGVHIKDVTGKITITDSAFDGNRSSGNGGGGLAIDDASTDDVTISSTSFTANKVINGEGGGASILAPDRFVVVEKSQFVSNTSQGGDTGGLHTRTRSAVVRDSDFEKNSATSDYGAFHVHAMAGNAFLSTKTGVDKNSAESGNSGAGRIESDNGDARFNGTASGNTAPSIAGVSLSAPNGKATVSNSLLDDNDASGSIGNLAVISAQEFLLFRSNISNGNAKSSPGAFVSQVGATTIERSTIATNTASDDSTSGGAGLSIVHGGAGKLSVLQSTITGNNSLGEGAGIRMSNISAEISHSTIVDNAAAIQGGAMAQIGVSSMAIDHSILSGNSAANFPQYAQPVSLDWSILNPAAGVPALGSDNQVGVDPKLGPLADNGDFTMTHLPSFDSPAVDSGNPALIWPAHSVDQRGFKRSIGLTDIGAVEVAAPLWIPVTPARIVDTRGNGDTIDDVDEATGALAASERRTITVAGRAGVPADAVGVIANVTAVNPSSFGYLTVDPCVEEMPLAASLNYTAGVNLGNEIVIGLDAGTLCVFSFAATHLTIDVVGYIPADSRYETTTPTRFLDTRANGVTFDGKFQAEGAPGAGKHVEVQMGGRKKLKIDAIDATMVVYVAAVGATSNGFITIWDCAGAMPLASSLNYVAGVNRGNEVLAKTGPNGELCIFTSSDVHVTIDLVGAIPDHSDFTALASPSRMLDTRANGKTVDGKYEAGGTTIAGEVLKLDLGGRVDIPADAKTVAVNLTVVKPADIGYVTAFPCGATPLAASVNHVPGVNGGNEIIASLDATGSLCLFTSASVHLTADVTGYTLG